MPTPKYFSVEGHPMSAVEIVTQIEYAFEDEVEAAAFSIRNDIERFIHRLNANSTMRGGVYDQPFKNAKVEIIKHSWGHMDVVVDHPFFRYLDGGRGNFKSSNIMRFPRYEGTLTSPGSLQLGNVEMVYETTASGKQKQSWVTIPPGTPNFGSVDARNILQTIVDRRRYLRAPIKALRSRFRFRFSKDELEVIVDSQE